MDEEEQTLFTRMCGMKISHSTVHDYPDIPKNINVLMVGKTGSGKSSTGNTLLGEKKYAASAKLSSVTKTVQKETVTEGGVNFTIIDTPGLFNTGEEKLSNADILLEFTKTAITCPEGIHVIFIVCKGGDRFTDEDRNTVNAIEEHFGKDIFNHCIIIFSNGYNLVEETHLSKHLRHVDKGLKELLKKVCYKAMAIENKSRNKTVDENQRMRLFCAVAEVVHFNKGRLYTVEFFEIALRNANERKQRSQSLIIMQKRVNKDLDKFIDNLDEGALNEIFKEEKLNELAIKQITVTVRKEDDLSFVKDNEISMFVEDRMKTKLKLVGLKLNRLKEENLIRQQCMILKQNLEEANARQRKLSAKNAEICHVKSTVKDILPSYINASTKSEIEQISCLKLPSTLFSSVKKTLRKLEYVDDDFVKNCIKQHFKYYISNMEERLDEILAKESEPRETLKEEERIKKEAARLKMEIHVFLQNYLRKVTKKDLFAVGSNLHFQTKLLLKVENTFSKNEHYTNVNITNLVQTFLRLNIRCEILRRLEEDRRRNEEERGNEITHLRQSLSHHVLSLIEKSDISALREISSLGWSSKAIKIFCGKLSYQNLEKKDIQQEVSDVLSQCKILISSTVRREEIRLEELLEQQRQQDCENQLLKSQVNEVIENKVESFLRSKDFEYLKTLKPQLKRRRVPSDIRPLVTREIEGALNEHQVDEIIIDVLNSHLNTIEEIIREKGGWFARNIIFASSAHLFWEETRMDVYVNYSS